MRYGCVVTKLKSASNSLVCKFTAKANNCGIVFRCRCNILAIGNKYIGNPLLFQGVKCRYKTCFHKFACVFVR